MNTLSDKLLERFQQNGPGTVLGNKSFLDLGSRAAVDQALSRLARQGAIRRITQGLYDHPRHHPTFGILSPNLDEVARAISSKNGSKLLASGAYAANLLGLSTQVPAKILYYTDGSDKRVQIGRQTLEFRHAGPRRMAGAGKISGLVIQALRWLGKDSIDENTIHRVQSVLRDDGREILRQDIATAPDWLRPALSQITSAT
jgi:hypothetical protein